MIFLLAAAAQAATPPAPPAPPAPEQRQVVVVRKVGPDGKVTEQRLEGADAARIVGVRQNCDPNRTFSSEVDRTVDGKRQVSRIRVCANRAESPAQWQQALRDTMARVRNDPNLSPEVRARVVNELVIALDKAGRP